MEELIVKVLRGQAAPHEEQELREWRAEDPLNDRRFREIQAVWQAVTPERLIGRVVPPPPLREILRSRPQRKRRGRSGVRAARWISAAAAAVIVMVGSVAIWHLVQDTAGRVEYAATTEEQTVVLSDGSIVRLAPGARLEFQSRGEGREATFDGWGFFAVAPDSLRPFVIRSRRRRIEVLGTRFDLRVESNRLQLVLVEGRVLLEVDGQGIRMQGGQRVVVDSTGVPVVSEFRDPLSTLGWPRALLIFQETPLQQVVSELSDHFHTMLEVDPRLATRTVTARFEEQTLDDVMEVLCAIVDAQCSVTSAGRRIAP